MKYVYYVTEHTICNLAAPTATVTATTTTSTTTIIIIDIFTQFSYVIDIIWAPFPSVNVSNPRNNR
jgi:hypothetical protein